MVGRTPNCHTLATVFALTLITYVYFYQGGGPNQFSRFGLTASLAEHGQVAIDPYHELTFDKAEKDDHYYCDKAPGLSLLAVPGYLLGRPLILAWTQPGSWPWVNLSLYVMTLTAVSVPVAVAMTSFYRRAYREAGPTAAFWVTVALGLGSPLTVFASLFYSHALCAALLWLAFDGLTGVGQASSLPASGRLEACPTPVAPWRGGVAGLLVGAATLSEFPAALAGGLFLLFLCLRKPRSWRAAGCYVLGGLPALAVLMAYNHAAFGRPLVSGYQFHVVEEFRQEMGRGIMGITGPSLFALKHMLFTPFRGLLWFWPFFISVIPACLYLLLERSKRDGPTILAGCVVGVYLLFGCSYYAWWGGASFGPRHVVPCLPFAAYLVVRSYDSIVRSLAPPLAVLSVAVALMSMSTLAEFPEPLKDGTTPERGNPLVQIALPRFLRGAVSVKMIDRDTEGIITWQETPLARSDPRYYDACNIGEVIGLDGLVSLLPLAVAWLVLGGTLWFGQRVPEHGESTPRADLPIA